MQLDLNLLTALDALLEEESVSGAASRLNLSEPALSRTLGRIRRVTGDPILVRVGRTMVPTPRARAMQEEVRSLVLRSRSVLSDRTTLDLAALDRTFTIRCHDALAAALAPVVVRRVAQFAPLVSLRFVGESAVDTPDLGRGLVDLEIGSRSAGAGDIEYEHVADDPLVGLMRRDNPFVGTGADLTSYAAAPHVIISRRGRFEDAVDTALATRSISRRVVASVASTAAALEIVRDTDALVTVPSSIASRATSDRGLERFDLPVELPHVPVVLAWPRRASTDPGHTWFRDIIRDGIQGILRDPM